MKVSISTTLKKLKTKYDYSAYGVAGREFLWVPSSYLAWVGTRHPKKFTGSCSFRNGNTGYK